MEISEVEINLLGPSFQISKFGAKIPGKGMAAVAMGGFFAQFSLEEGQKRVALPHTRSCSESESIHPTAVGSRT